ncbi:MAG: RDD family protein [Deltaproteobacteria bacterium]|nr:RDD family protein [Deltaproteobacteria bacterium]
MRCPTCGYHTFEHMDQCKKCGQDLKEFKARYGIFGSQPQGDNSDAPGSSDKGSEDLGSVFGDFEVEKEEEEFQIPEPEFWDTEKLEELQKPEETEEEAITVSEPEQEADEPLSEKDDFQGWEADAGDFDFSKEYEDSGEVKLDFLGPEKPEELPVIEDQQETPSSPEDVKKKTETLNNEGEWADQEPELPVADIAKEVEVCEVSESDFLEPEKSPELEELQEELSSGGEKIEAVQEIEEKPSESPDEDILPEAGVLSEELKSFPEMEPEEPFSPPEDKWGNELSREEERRASEEEFGAVEMMAQASEAAPEFIFSAEAEAEEQELMEDQPDEEELHPGEEALAAESQIFPRLGAWLADSSILSVIFLAFVVLGKVGLGSQESHGLFPTQAALLIELLVPYFFLFFALCFGYFTVFHFLTGQTPGKMLFNIRVEDEKGFPLMFSQAFLRSTGGLLSILLLGFGYLMILFNPDRRGWNDRLAGTRVVRVEPQ